MADLGTSFVGIRTPNPFWVASGPPTDKEYNVNRAFEAGWGGVMWKTLGEDPPIVNINGPRYGAIYGDDRKVIGFNNVELITDRPLQINLDEIKRVKRDWPDRGLVVSLMVPCEQKNWKDIIDKVVDTGADGIELNFGCPHGMSERGMGSAVGQVPDYVKMVTEWCKGASDLPVVVKLTPNVASIFPPALAAHEGGADAVSLINTVNSIMGVDLDRMVVDPPTDGMGTHGGYCGPAVRPIALNMVAEIKRNPKTADLPVSAIGGIGTWSDAAQFMALGAANVQVCTAAMLFGFKIVDDMIAGLESFLDRKGFKSVDDLVGAAVGSVTDWGSLNLNYVAKARIDQDLCIKCGRCHIACEDTSHQAITSSANGERHFEVIDEKCVGCNLCTCVCPIEGCITMEHIETGVDARTGQEITGEKLVWADHPNNPDSACAAPSGK